MDTERCKEFVVLAQTKNFLEASNQLFIAQSSLSKHIKSLEKELGVTLLDRSTRHVELSPAGRVFLPYAKKLVQIDHEALTALFNSSENKRDVLRRVAPQRPCSSRPTCSPRCSTAPRPPTAGAW